MTAQAMDSLNPSDVDARQPLLVRIVRDIIQSHEALRTLRARRRNAGRGAKAEPDEAAAASKELALREEERRLTQVLASLEAEIEQLGGVLADASTGLIEFPSNLKGRPVLLSWRPEDARVAFYRRPEAGRDDRVALPVNGGDSGSVSEESL